MTNDITNEGTDPGTARSVPADLAAVLGYTIVTVVATTVPVINTTPFRSVLAVPFVLFIPGYAIVAALYPEGRRTPPDGNGVSAAARSTATAPTGDPVGLTGIERVALSFGVSVAVVPLIGLVLNVSPAGIRLTPVLAAVSGVTVAATGVAAYRRRQLPKHERLVVPYRRWIRSVIGTFTGHESRKDAALSLLVVVCVLVAVSSVGYAFAVPKQADSFTELYIVTEQENGELIADSYPTEFTVGEPEQLTVGIGNYEHREVEYSLIVELQDAAVVNNSTTVRQRDELLRRQPTLSDEETWHEQMNITPETTGERLRLAFLLYKNDPPSNPTTENAYREAHLWINVSDPS
jgi:uncharacterized membrane protein